MFFGRGGWRNELVASPPTPLRKMERGDKAGKSILELYTLSRLDKWNDSIREQENIDACVKIRFL